MSLIEQLFKTVLDGNSELVVSLGNEILKQELDINDGIINAYYFLKYKIISSFWFIKNIVKKIKKKKNIIKLKLSPSAYL